MNASRPWKAPKVEGAAPNRIWTDRRGVKTWEADRHYCPKVGHDCAYRSCPNSLCWPDSVSQRVNDRRLGL